MQRMNFLPKQHLLLNNLSTAKATARWPACASTTGLSVVTANGEQQKKTITSSASRQSASADAKVVAPEFWAKNQQLNRPMSPFTMYKPQITTVLSISHRISGLGMGLPLYAMGLTQLLTSQNWAGQLTQLQAASPILFTTFKVLVLAGISFHALNGIRHLAWDLGYGFRLKTLYASGYLVIVLSILGTLITAARYL